MTYAAYIYPIGLISGHMGVLCFGQVLFWSDAKVGAHDLKSRVMQAIGFSHIIHRGKAIDAGPEFYNPVGHRVSHAGEYLKIVRRCGVHINCFVVGLCGFWGNSWLQGYYIVFLGIYGAKPYKWQYGCHGFFAYAGYVVQVFGFVEFTHLVTVMEYICLLYTSDAADE